MMKVLVVILPLALVAAGSAIVLGPFTFHGRSVCERCGMIRRTQMKQLPFTEFTYWRTDSDEPSSLSRSLERLGIAGPHVHSWVFVRGAGNGVQ